MADRVGQQLGNYRLLRKLGEGGFAEVYLGEHIHLKTQAAIKVLLAHLSQQEMQGFLTEAQTIAHLKHPHIVRVLDFGVQSGTAYLVMDHAPNGTLRDHHARGKPLALAAVLPSIRQIADALQYAHDQRVIHRDIKPENMLLGANHESLLSDFGIALMIRTGHSRSTQDATGTAPYMAPEQITGHPTPASDQYALAIVVYEWLTGAPPFEGSLVEVIGKHLHQPPEPLHQRAPTIQPLAEQVVLKALSKDPQQRFAKVQAFANALEYASQPPPPAQAPTIPVPPSRSPAALYNLPTRRIQPTQPPGTLLRTYKGHSGQVLAVTWSPDGKRIASGGEDKTAQVWDAATGARLFSAVPHDNKQVSQVAWSPDGKRVASGGLDTKVQVWEAAAGNRLFACSPFYGYSYGWASLGWSPDGKYLAYSYSYGVRVCDGQQGQALFDYQGHVQGVLTFAWSPDSKYIASGSTDGAIQVWAVATRECLIGYTGYTSQVRAVAWSPDGTRIASSAVDKQEVQLWDAATGALLGAYLKQTGNTQATAWSPDGGRLACVVIGQANKCAVHVIDISANKSLVSYEGHTGRVWSIAWSPDGTRIASAGEDGTVQIWSAG